MARRVSVWTWDRGTRPIDMDGPPELLVPILENVLNGGLWREFMKFPLPTLERLLPLIEIPLNVRRLVEIWLEEKRTTA